MPSLPGVQTLDPSKVGTPAVAAALDRLAPGALWTGLSPAQRQQFRGFLAPLLKLSESVNATQAWAWDAQWRGPSEAPRVSFFQTSPGRGMTVEKLFLGSPEASFEVYDARDRLMCGDAGCNPPFQTWMGVQPDSAQQYCSPDTLVSVLFQFPRYRVARERLRSMLARLPGGFSFDVRNWPIERRNRYYALNPGTPGSVGYADRVKAQKDDYYAQVNEVVASDPRAWAAWCAEADALCRMALWATNARSELLYDWIDPRHIAREGGQLGGAFVEWSTRIAGSSPGERYNDFLDSFPEELRYFPLWNPREEPRPVSPLSDRIPRFFYQSSRHLYSCHLWQASNVHRNLSRWMTHRYPLSATLYRRGLYDQGREGATDLPKRYLPLRVPMDMRYFIADNTVPVPIWSQEGSERGFWGCFSGDAWGATPGENVAWYPTPGVASSLLEKLDETTADEYDRRTVSSLEVFFGSARRGGAFDGSPISRRMVPLRYERPQARGSAIIRAGYLWSQQYDRAKHANVGPDVRLDTGPLPGSEQWVVVPSPALYVRMVHDRATEVERTTFEQFGSRGLNKWLAIYNSLAEKRLLPPGANPGEMRRAASLAFQGDLDGLSSQIGQVAGAYAFVLGLISGVAGAVAAALFAVLQVVVSNLQDWKLARGTNPLTLPMATARYIAADPAGAIRECDFSGAAGSYDDLIPQVRVISTALASGQLDALKLFTEIGKAVGSTEVEDQALPDPGGGRREPTKEPASGGAAVPLVGAALLVWLLMRGQK